MIRAGERLNLRLGDGSGWLARLAQLRKFWKPVRRAIVGRLRAFKEDHGSCGLSQCARSLLGPRSPRLPDVSLDEGNRVALPVADHASERDKWGASFARSSALAQ